MQSQIFNANRKAQNQKEAVVRPYFKYNNSGYKYHP